MSDDLTIAYMLGVEDMRSRLHKQADEIERLRAENETLRRDVKTAVMGDSAELQDVKRENEKLPEELNCWHETANWPEKSPQALRAENEKLYNANLSLRNKYLRLQHKLGRIAKVLDEPTVAAAAIRESGDE